MSEQMQTGEHTPQPRIVYGEGIDPSVSVEPEIAAETMRELGVSEAGIANSAIYVDPRNRIANNGTHYSNTQAKLHFRSVPELQDVEGDVVRISTKVRGKERTAELMNKTLTHEWEHLAQADRHDRKVTEGHIAIYGLAALGALAGNRLGKGAKGKIGAAIGGFLGYQLWAIGRHLTNVKHGYEQVRGVA